MKIPGNRVGCPVLRFVQILGVVLVQSAAYVPRDWMEDNCRKKESGSIFEVFTHGTEWSRPDENGATDFSMRAAISGDNTLVGTYFSNLNSSNRTHISCCNVCIATRSTVMSSNFILSRRLNNLSEGWTNAHIGEGVASAATKPHHSFGGISVTLDIRIRLSFHIIHESYHRWYIV